MTTLAQEGAMVLRWGVVLVASCVAGLLDLRTRRIPNLLTFPLVLTGYAGAAIGGGLAGLVDSVAASVLLSAPYLVLFIFAGGGAGDVKIMAALGAWLGLVNGLVVLLAVAGAGAVFASTVLIGRAWKESEDRPALKAIQIPYGMAVWAGVWAAAAGVLVWQ